VNVCRIEDDVCAGCGRRIEEIVNWQHMSEDEQQRVVDRLFG